MKMYPGQRKTPIHIFLFLFALLSVTFTASSFAQVDQGAVTGVVQDQTGAAIPSAQVTLTNTDTGLVLKQKANGSGIYVFSPVKIGHYQVSAVAAGFQNTVQQNLQLNLQGRLNIVLTLKPGAVDQTVTVSTAPPIMQTQSGSVGQVFSTQTINNTPLIGRNWVYMAQLSAGVVATPGSRGGGTGDFSANGQRPDQNDFVLDGVDNNVDIADYQNGASFNVKPPPDALAEFQVQTSDYSAEFGHSVGAVLNASIKSGTNQVHGDAWEYFRNTKLADPDWDALTAPPYHENQFGATLGFPILRDKLFYFGDTEANRISYSSTNTINVPTPLMRQGNFSELLNPALTGESYAINLYEPNTATTLMSCNGQQNVLCNGQNGTVNQIDPVAQNILNLYPLPNTNNGDTYDNYNENLPYTDNTFQWDQRIDYNISAKDQTYARYSYQHEQLHNTPPLGPILDGTGSYAGVNQNFLSENGMASETHIFNPNLVNEFRVSYNWGSFENLQENYNVDLSATLGLGGIPYGAGYPDNGGLPSVSVSGIQSWGTHGFDPSNKKQNIYQILDNVTWNVGNHSLKFGVDFQSLRSSSLSPPNSRGSYTFNGRFTSDPAISNTTGSGVADFLTDQVYSAAVGNETTENFARWYRSGYVQDDWRITKKLTLNLGMRYDYYQSPKEMANRQANLVVTTSGVGTGTGIFELPSADRNLALAPAYTALLAQEGVSIEYLDNPALVTVQKDNFAPRIGFAYSISDKTVVHGGFGIFYGGLEPYGGQNIGEDQPFFTTATFPTTTGCTANNCPSDGLALETGFTNAINVGLGSYISSPTFDVTDPNVKTPNTDGYNLTLQQTLTNNIVATIAYVGNVSHRLPTSININNANAIQNSSKSATTAEPFPKFGSITDVTYEGQSMYNGLQTKLQKRFSDGLNFLVTYTWAHTMDDSSDPLNGGTSYHNPNIIPLIDEYTNSAQDVRNRLTFNGFYQLPFGIGRAHMNHSHVLDEIAGGWSTNLTFVAQSGQPFSVSANNTGPVGLTRNAIMIRSPYTTGGPQTNNAATCATSTRNRTHWYNPCSFSNPIAGTAATGPAVPTSGIANVLPYAGGKSNLVYGPGYNRVNISLFKDFATFRKQYLEFRADSFNLLNHPSLANPSSQGTNTAGGLITAPKSLQTHSPDARFFQLSAKYVF
jgi:hypothetical protein